MLMIGEADTLNKTLLRVGEAAELLSVRRWTIYRWVEEGRLRGPRVGKSSLRIFRDSIVGLIERNECTMSTVFRRSERS
jgi:excisionase family DNA binding protein